MPPSHGRALPSKRRISKAQWPRWPASEPRSTPSSTRSRSTTRIPPSARPGSTCSRECATRSTAWPIFHGSKDEALALTPGERGPGPLRQHIDSANGARRPRGVGACAGKAGMTQFVYRFGGGVSDGQAGDRNLLGGKGANLAEMASIGLPVPPGFTISTEMCAVYYAQGESFPDGLREEVASGLAHIEGLTGKKFGDAADPLLVSVRSGARVSMPGMMDTVLNLGLNDATVEGLAAI